MANKRNAKRDNRSSGRTQKGKKASASARKTGSSNQGRDFDRDTRDHYSNDPSWYALSPQMLIDAASLGYSNVLGSTQRPYVDCKSMWNGVDALGFPGIMAIDTIPLPGVSTDNSSPVNVAARNIYSFVRHANSGHSNYDSPDLMMYILAMDSLYSIWAFMVRAYGVINSYAVYNKYYAESIFKSMSLDYEDFCYNIADFRSFINMFAHKLSKICCPTSLTYITRHVWMYSHIWVDSPSKKAQSYLYVPEQLWMYDEKAQDGGRLTPVPIGPEMTFYDLRAAAENMLAKLLESEDMMIMSGDILKAFGPEKLMSLTTIPEDFFIIPEFSPEVCAQIQNCYLVGQVDPFTIHQDPNTGAVICEPTIVKGMGSPHSLHLNLRLDAPTPADTMVATRLMVGIQEFTDESDAIWTCGSDIATKARVYTMSRTGKSTTLTHDTFYSYVRTGDYADDVDSLIWQLLTMEKFDWHPTQYLVAQGDDQIGVSGDVDNFTVLDLNDLDDMHQLALISQFGCPSMGPFAIK